MQSVLNIHTISPTAYSYGPMVFTRLRPTKDQQAVIRCKPWPYVKSSDLVAVTTTTWQVFGRSGGCHQQMNSPVLAESGERGQCKQAKLEEEATQAHRYAEGLREQAKTTKLANDTSKRDSKL